MSPKNITQLASRVARLKRMSSKKEKVDQDAQVTASVETPKARNVDTSLQGLRALAAKNQTRRRSSRNVLAAGVSGTSVVASSPIMAKRQDSLNRKRSMQLGSGYGAFTAKWSCGDLLGRGQFGAVHLAENLDNGEKLAVKRVTIRSVELLDEMVKEVAIMCRASFGNINVVSCVVVSGRGR